MARAAQQATLGQVDLVMRLGSNVGPSVRGQKTWPWRNLAACNTMGSAIVVVLSEAPVFSCSIVVLFAERT